MPITEADVEAVRRAVETEIAPNTALVERLLGLVEHQRDRLDDLERQLQAHAQLLAVLRECMFDDTDTTETPARTH